MQALFARRYTQQPVIVVAREYVVDETPVEVISLYIHGRPRDCQVFKV